MDKRFQFFVSSTFTDLRDERQAVLKALLGIDHMPAGMELFPASDAQAWQLIQGVIEASDYYVLIIGARYGSVDEEGLSYTEREYDHAVKSSKPVLAFLHKDPGALPRDKTDKNDAAWQKLEAFREKVEKKHHCQYWTSADDLKAQVIVGAIAAIKAKPAVGWVRADTVPTGAAVADVLGLRNRIAELEAKLQEAAVVPPPGTEDLEQGDEWIKIGVTFMASASEAYGPASSYTAAIVPTWNEIFAGVAPTMINEASDDDLHSAFRKLFERLAIERYQDDKDLKGRSLYNFGFRGDQIETCIVQFRALGLIRENVKPRSVKDTSTYWKLTPYGDHLMTQLRAIRRDPEDEEPEEPVKKTRRKAAAK